MTMFPPANLLRRLITIFDVRYVDQDLLRRRGRDEMGWDGMGAGPVVAAISRRDHLIRGAEFVELRHYTAGPARELVPRFLDLYAEVYGVAPYAGDPFFSVRTYAGRLDGALGMAGFEIVTATENGTLIGTGHGVTLPPAVAWWQTLRPSLPHDLVRQAEQGRVFWLRELMVREPYRNKGVGRAPATPPWCGRTVDEKRAQAGSTAAAARPTRSSSVSGTARFSTASAI